MKQRENRKKGNFILDLDQTLISAEPCEEYDFKKNKQKAKKFHKAKELAYRKSKQPVTDGTGENSGSGVNIKLESIDKKTEKLNEEFNRMKTLIGYSQRTQ